MSTSGSGTGPRSPAETVDRSVPMLIAAGTLVLAVVGAALVFGVDRPPSVEPMSAEPTFTPPGAIAWASWTGDENCLYVAEPRGEVREVVCGLDGDAVVGWTDDGILVREFTGREPAVAAIDPVTGERSGVAVEVPRAAGDPAARLQTDHHDGILDVEVVGPGQERVRVWQVEAPGSYDVVTATAAPDEDVVAMTDTAGRLLVAPLDGSAPPRLWSDDVDRHARLTWEGTEPAG